MATKRTYGDGCGAAHGLDLIGERWALLIVRELLLGPKRFTDLRAGVPGASPNVISERLRELERAGVVRRRKLPPPASSRVYELTEWGREIEPVVLGLGRWASRSPNMPQDLPIGRDSLILAMRTMFDADAAKGLEASYELRLDEDRFRAAVAGGELEVCRGSATEPDAIIETGAPTWDALLFRDRPLADAISAGDVRVEGDTEAVERLLGLFPLPDPVAVEVGA
ncbi:MAG: winged helix-turn-helix transcriptional regulator [Solirubrobacterales bacterium]